MLAACDEKKGRKVLGRGPVKEELMQHGDQGNARARNGALGAIMGTLGELEMAGNREPN